MEIINRIFIVSVVAAAAFLCCGCNTNAYDYDYLPVEEEQGDPDGKQEETEKVKEYTISGYEAFETDVKELSSICFNKASDGLYAVSDEGKVYEIGFDGKTKSVLYGKSNHDWEGVEFSGKEILLMDEGESALYKLQDGDISRIAEIKIPDGGEKNKGPEGIMCVKDTVFVGNQCSPTRIVKYCLTAGKVCGYFDVKFVSKYISDLCYDKTDNTMWIVDSKGPAFYHSTLDGKLIATYKIPFVNQAEAIAVDRTKGIVWIGCDTSSKLYRIKLPQS